jgi:3-hydroxyacyl-[acyl-carrier-protein] dehydratase
MQTIEDHIHHRDPFLLIDKIVESSSNFIQTQKYVSGDEFFCQGHFPGAPVVPGSLMHEMTTQTAGVLIAKYHNPMSDYNTHDPFHNPYALGVLHKTKFAKYKGFAKPKDTLNIKVTLIDSQDSYFTFKGEITVNDKIIMKNEFCLCNIESKLLM